jgi:RNA polymerase sigma-70 factor (ECF subfamily)
MTTSANSANRHLVQYYDELVDYIGLKIGNRQLAKDVVQETYLRIFQRPNQFDDLVHPIAFLKKVSLHIAFDILKKHKTYDKYFESLDIEDHVFYEIDHESTYLSIPELSVAREQYAQLILTRISSLPPACQDVFLLIQFYGMTQVEVAEQIGISRTMVIKHFTRALQQFADLFDSEYD